MQVEFSVKQRVSLFFPSLDIFIMQQRCDTSYAPRGCVAWGVDVGGDSPTLEDVGDTGPSTVGLPGTLDREASLTLLGCKSLIDQGQEEDTGQPCRQYVEKSRRAKEQKDRH